MNPLIPLSPALARLRLASILQFSLLTANIPSMSTLLLMCAGLTALAYLVWLKHAALSLTPSLATQEEQKRATASASKERRLPSPTPWLDFDLATAQTRDFIYENQPLVRDFIAGTSWQLKRYLQRLPYKQTMAHKPMRMCYLRPT